MLEDLLTLQGACQNFWLSYSVANNSALLAVLHMQCYSAWPCRWQHLNTLKQQQLLVKPNSI